MYNLLKVFYNLTFMEALEFEFPPKLLQYYGNSVSTIAMMLQYRGQSGISKDRDQREVSVHC